MSFIVPPLVARFEQLNVIMSHMPVLSNTIYTVMLDADAQIPDLTWRYLVEIYTDGERQQQQQGDELSVDYKEGDEMLSDIEKYETLSELCAYETMPVHDDSSLRLSSPPLTPSIQRPFIPSTQPIPEDNTEYTEHFLVSTKEAQVFTKAQASTLELIRSASKAKIGYTKSKAINGKSMIKVTITGNAISLKTGKHMLLKLMKNAPLMENL